MRDRFKLYEIIAFVENYRKKGQPKHDKCYDSTTVNLKNIVEIRNSAKELTMMFLKMFNNDCEKSAVFVWNLCSNINKAEAEGKTELDITNLLENNSEGWGRQKMLHKLISTGLFEFVDKESQKKSIICRTPKKVDCDKNFTFKIVWKGIMV